MPTNKVKYEIPRQKQYLVGSLCGVEANVLDFNIVWNKFELQ